ncbi:hypothetical protein A4X13_0g1534 [Tilletia indica]|uniref:Anaphase-promoting complex subunit 1 N-terminal domain-containing protein n=1 Tax=Tilletia indica TaxID=43049 RepID=A0A177TLB3_9BASI|nr:hypothetical protein A4X13_0g1534 [Tilletia indica]
MDATNVQSSQCDGPSVGDAIAEAHRAARVVSPEHQRQVALEERLSSMLTAAGSEADSQLKRLQSIFGPSKKNGRAMGADRKGKRVVRDADQEQGEDECGAQEELYWFENTLIWSRLPSTVLRSFSFSTPITHACWARFELSNVALAESAERPPIGFHAQANTAQQRNAQTHPKLPIIPQARPGGFSLAQNHVRMSDQRIRTRTAQKPPYRQNSETSVDDGDQQAQSNIQNALCIFLQNTLVLYFPASGDEHLIQLPFRVKSVFPLALGLLVQREVEAEDVRYEAQQQRHILLDGEDGRLLLNGADSTDDDIMEETGGKGHSADELELEPPPLPLAFYLCRPFDEFAGFDRVTQVIESHSAAQTFPLVRRLGPQASGYLSRPPLRVNEFSSLNFPDLAERIIYVEDDKDGTSLPIIVTAHYGKRCIRIFQYGISGVSLQSVQNVSALMGFDSQRQTQTQMQTQTQTQSETQVTVADSQYSQVEDAIMSQYTAPADSQNTAPALSESSTVRNLGRGRPPPRRSARIEKTSVHSQPSVSSSAGINAGVAGSGAGAGSNTTSGGSQTHGRPNPRLSRRVSSSAHGADLRRLSTRGAVDRTGPVGSVGEEIRAGMSIPMDNSQHERGGFAEVVQGINREQLPVERASQPVGTGTGMGHSQFIEEGGPHSQPIHGNPRARSSSATQRPSHGRRSSHLSISRVVSGAAGSGASTTLVGGIAANQQRHGSGSSTTMPISGPGGITVGSRVPSSRRQPSISAHITVQPSSDATANHAIGGSQFDPHDRSYAAATIVQQAGAMAHEPGAPIPLPLRPSPGPAHARMTADRDEDEEEGLEGAGDFARTFGGIALLDEIRVEGLDSEEKAEHVCAFVTSSDARPLDNAAFAGRGSGAKSLTTAVVWISIPASNALVSRVISEIPLHFNDISSATLDVESRIKFGFSLRSSQPDPLIAQPFVEASAAYAVRRPQSASLTKASRLTHVTAPTSSDVVIRIPNGSTHLVLGSLSKGQPVIEVPPPIQPVAFPNATGSQHLPAQFSIQCELSNQVLDALERTLVGREGSKIRHALLTAKQRIQPEAQTAGDDWSLLSDVLLGGRPASEPSATNGEDAWSRLSRTSAHVRHHADHVLFRSSKMPLQAATSNTPSFNTSQRRSHMVILRVLHLVAQELLASSSRVTDNLLRLSKLIVSLACRVGYLSWAEYWTRIVPATASKFSTGVALLDDADTDVPTVSDVLITALVGQSGRDMEDALVDYFIGPIRKDHISTHAVCPTVTTLVRIYRAFGTALANTALGPAERARVVVDAIVREGMTRSDLAALSFGYALPLWEAIRLGQAHPDTRWSAEALLLVDRSDLVRSREDKVVMALKYTEAQLRTLPTTECLDPLSAVLFGADFRLDEVVKMMYTSGVTTIDFPERDEKKTDAEVKEEQSRIYWSVTERIKATTVGKGAFLLMSKPFINTQLWDVPKFCLDLRGEPNALITTWPINKVSEFELEWPEFHNGVSAALSIWAEEGQAFESDWIFSHYGSEPSAKHAGFLFGLGLLGRLKSLGRVHAYRYFAPRHGITTIGIVLGLGASFVGTGDPAVRQLMALQIAAFLPDGSAPLNQSMLTQTAGILGMGLTFMGSYHRWTAERLLAQIRVENIQTSDNPMFLRDVYALSSGFALGLVMLGKGRRDSMTGAADRRLIGSLVELIEGPQPVLFDGETSGFSSKDTTITNIPATIALGLIFLRSNRRDVVTQLLRLPSSADALEYVRPDTLFARSLAWSLIMWDSIRADTEWMEASLPEYLRTPEVSVVAGEGSSSQWDRSKIRERMRSKLAKFNESMQLAYLNIHAACCFAIGLKWAGSQDLHAAECLLQEYDVLVDVLRPASTTYFERIRRAALQTAKDLALLSCSLILAGSGHLPLLTRLRLEHGKIESPPSQSVYGSYLSSHLALGFLFLGGGRYTFGTSDGAIASLLIACFPRFQATSSENRMHLQAYRHLWVLAIEPRLVVAQDVENGVVQSLQAVVGLKNEDVPTKKKKEKSPDVEGGQVEVPKALSLPLPGQAPSFERLDSIKIESAAFWGSELRVGQEREHARRLLLTRRLPVKRRSGFSTLTGSSSSDATDRNESSKQASSGLDGLAADLARLTGNRMEVGSDVNGSKEKTTAVTSLAAERMFSLERRTLSTSLGLEHAITLGRLRGLITDANQSEEDVEDLLHSFVRTPAEREWLRLVLTNIDDGDESRSPFQEYTVRALISVLVSDGPVEVLTQGLLGLFWRAECLAQGRVKMGGIDLDAGRIAEQIGFLQVLYGLRGDALGSDAAAPPPLLLSGLGLSWTNQGRGKIGSDPLISTDLVEATARALRTRARAVWQLGERLADHQEGERRTGADAFASALREVVDSRCDEAEDVRLLSAVFSTAVAPWIWSVLRPFFPRACALAKDQLSAGMEETRAGEVVGKVLDWALEEAKPTMIAGSKWAIEPYVRDAFIQLTLQHAKMS